VKIVDLVTLAGKEQKSEQILGLVCKPEDLFENCKTANVCQFAAGKESEMYAATSQAIGNPTVRSESSFSIFFVTF
jgi:hypothetical protein